MARLIFAIGALLGLVGGAFAEPRGDGMKTVIGDRFPLSRLCYENARDEEIGAEALLPCKQSLETEQLSDRRRAVVYANRGVIQFHSGDYEAAVLDFTAALDLGIFLPSRLHVNRGLAYEVLRYDALARADYRAALAISPGNEIAKRRLAELEKPFYERSQIPRKITAEAPAEDPEEDS
jgi:tetratricopeptide (TPR) repeat protein